MLNKKHLLFFFHSTYDYLIQMKATNKGSGISDYKEP